LDGLRQAQGKEGEWSIEIEENVRQFVASGLAEAGGKLDGEKPNVGLAKMQVRELRMRKTASELEIQRCVGTVCQFARALTLTPMTGELSLSIGGHHRLLWRRFELFENSYDLE